MRWQLVTKTWAKRQQHVFLTDQWPIPLAALAEDAQQLDREQWEWPASTAPERPLNTWLPATVLARAQQEVDQITREASTLPPDKTRLSGARVTLLGTYIHEVDIEWGSNRERLYVGGLRSRIFTSRGLARAPSIWRRLVNVWNWLVLQIAGVDHRPPVEQVYIRAIQAGTVHLSDSRSIVPAAGALVAATVEVSEQGYSISLTTAKHTKKMDFVTTFDVNSSQQMLLCTRYRLGPAHRDKFPEALAAGARLTFGRIGVVEVSSTGQAFFEFVDCRSYEFVQPAHYAIVLQTASIELNQIIRDNALG